jgi:hypothetical protein
MMFDEGSSRKDYIVDEQGYGVIQEEMCYITLAPTLSFILEDHFLA